MQDDCEASSHESNLDYLKQLTKHIQKLIKDKRLNIDNSTFIDIIYNNSLHIIF
ncbi:hypothetical protein [Clostridium sp. CMCC3677]|uniref:hypothetical protein n=1 Tax=Clostridium sp. CMCC3677 TaxID=2949963 RepID=UPI0020794A2C|nr:hypothetical protein [Clostridium sp. CMCC3677]